MSKGIYWRRDVNKYHVQIDAHYTTFSLGYYADKSDAEEVAQAFRAALTQSENIYGPNDSDEKLTLLQETAEDMRRRAKTNNQRDRTQRRLSQTQQLTEHERKIDQLMDRVRKLEGKP